MATPSPTSPPACAACGRAATTQLLKDGFVYWRCPECRLAVLAPERLGDRPQMFDAGYFQGDDSSGYHDYVAEELSHRRNAVARLGALAAAGVRGGELLEIGTAAGFLLDEAQRRGFRVSGVDISPWGRAETARRIGVTIQARIDEVPRPAQGFAAVVMLQVLEHIPEAPAVLGQAAALLAPGGVLLLETWDADSRVARMFGPRWQQVSPPSVVWLFGRGNLPRLFANQGLTIEHIATPGKRVGLGLVLHQTVGKLGWPGRKLLAVLRRLGLFRLTLRYRGKDLITVLARRPANAPSAR